MIPFPMYCVGLCCLHSSCPSWIPHPRLRLLLLLGAASREEGAAAGVEGAAGVV